jgi:hypothetical protein
MIQAEELEEAGEAEEVRRIQKDDRYVWNFKD